MLGICDNQLHHRDLDIVVHKTGTFLKNFPMGCLSGARHNLEIPTIILHLSTCTKLFPKSLCCSYPATSITLPFLHFILDSSHFFSQLSAPTFLCSFLSNAIYYDWFAFRFYFKVHSSSLLGRSAWIGFRLMTSLARSKT